MIKNKTTNQMYIGQSINIEKRWKKHCGGYEKKNSYIDRAIDKYGKNNFTISIIYKTEKDSELLNKLEQYYIWKYDTFENDHNYNLTPGGDFCPTKIPTIAKKISKSMKGKKNRLGTKHSESTKRKMSEIHKGKQYALNHKQTLKHKENISKASNTSGYFRVHKVKSESCKQGFTYVYRYHNSEGKRIAIYSVDIKKLEKKVKNRGLKWKKFKK